MGDQLQKLHLIPLIENAIRECAFPDEFIVRFKSYEAKRAPDGWFHPSSHPEMDERKLYYYLAEPEAWNEETFDYGPRMSVLMGSAMHDVAQTVMYEMGLLARPTGTCLCCLRPHGTGPGQCPEWGVRDEKLGRRGHLDGLLTIDGWNDSEQGVWDLKTCAPPVIRGIENNDLVAFKAKWPGYYGQQQDYLSQTGKRASLVLFLSMSEGWQMKEFTIPRDEAYIARLEAKYAAVRRYVERQTVPPVACCSSKATARRCPATACPVKIGLAA